MALAGQASAHKPQVVPMHFPSSKITEKSSFSVIALTGQRERHAPQSKHSWLSISISLRTLTVTPLSRKALTILSRWVEGISASISPPSWLMWALRMFTGTPCSRIISAVMGWPTSFSENLSRSLTKFFTFQLALICLRR